MTIIDLFNSWPTPIKIIAGLIFAVWLIEMLLLPFKLNMFHNSMRHVEALLAQIMSRIEVNKELNIDCKKLLELFQKLMFKKDKEL